MTPLLTAALCAVLCGVLGLGVPRLVAAIPEPVSEPVPEPDPEPEALPEPEPLSAAEADEEDRLFASSLPPAPPKVPYAELARARGLAAGSAVASAVAGGLVGGAVGWAGALVFLVPLVPVSVALFVIDWRVHLLPTWVLHRAYVAMAVLVPLAALLDRELDALVTAAWGWLVLGGWFWGMWVLTRGGGWGFGDVRLSRVLGPALGYLGWYEIVTGLFLITLLGGLGGLVAVAARRKLRQRLPYGPFMLAGSLLAVVLGRSLAQGLGY